jgi:hypothetical protein
MIPGGDCMTRGVDEHVVSVTTKKDIVTVVSEPQMMTQTTATFNLADPNQCRLFLRAIEETPDLMQKIGLENKHAIVAQAIETLGKSFKDSVPDLIRTDLATIKAVGESYTGYKVVAKAVVAANEFAAKKNVEAPTSLKPVLAGRHRDEAIAKAME